MRNVTLKQFQTFSTVARTGSFARAAEALFISAPAVSMQMRELEEEMGLSLFERQGRNLVLTAAGRDVLVCVRRVLADLKETENLVQRIKGLEVGHVNIGLVSTSKYLMPQLLVGFRERYPEIHLKIDVANRNQLSAMLRDGEIDIAIMGRPAPGLDALSHAFAENPHVFVAGRHHPLAGQANVAPHTLLDYDLLAREPDSGTRAVMTDFFEGVGLNPHYAMEMSSNESIKQAVIAGLGITFTSMYTVRLEVDTGLITVLDVVDTPVRRVWHLVYAAGRVLSPAAAAFHDHVLTQVRDFPSAQAALT